MIRSFVPRAFSFSHINLTHRNWTAVGLPDLPVYPIVDPRGLVTPLYDGWSLDFWIVAENGRCLLPSKLADAAGDAAPDLRSDPGGDDGVPAAGTRPVAGNPHG